MGVQKNSDAENYTFVEFSRAGQLSGNQNVNNINNEFSANDADFSALVSEVDIADAERFKIDKEVFDLRQHRKAKKNELEQKIEERIQNDLSKIKESAYKEGFEKGLQDGMQKSYEEQQSAIEIKVSEMRGMIDNLLNRQIDIVKTQDSDLNKLIRDLTKWITLKDLKEDDEYILRLVSKVFEENKKTSKIIFQIGHGVFASFKNSVEELNEKMQEIYQGQVEIVESTNLDKDSIEIEIGSNILKANISDQLKSFDQIFEVAGND
jgi:flagellar assembly protein FliH